MTSLRKLALGVAAAGLAGVALAQGGQAGGSSGTEVTGKVERRAHHDSSITVRSSEQKEQKLKIDSGTTVTKDGRPAKYDDIEPGDEVRASLAGSGDCTRLDVTSAEARGSSGK